MVKKIKTCIFISGNGSNLNSIIKSSRDYSFPIKIELIISNNDKAKGIGFARKYGIFYKFFPSKYQKKFERNVLCELKKRKIKFICLAGFMKILSNDFINEFGHKIINIHPSLLPKYKGLNTHKRAINIANDPNIPTRAIPRWSEKPSIKNETPSIIVVKVTALPT